MDKKTKFILISIILILVICIINKLGYTETTYVKGNSMYPSFLSWEKVCLNYNSKNIKRGDVIWFALKNNGRYIKRVIAIPGDEVIFGKDWYIYINWNKLNEDYLATNQHFKANWLKLLLIQLQNFNNIIPSNMFLVMWDNRRISLDSSNFWLIDLEQIIWKVSKPIFWKCF